MKSLLYFLVSTSQKLVKSLTPSKPDFHLEAFKSPQGPDLKNIGYYSGHLNVLKEDMTFSPPSCPSIKLKPIFTPGHSVDHMCFAMYVNDVVECVFVGDLLLGTSSPCFFKYSMCFWIGANPRLPFNLTEFTSLRVLWFQGSVDHWQGWTWSICKEYQVFFNYKSSIHVISNVSGSILEIVHMLSLRR